MKMRSNRMRLIWFGALILLLNALAGTAGAGEDETVPDTQPSGDLQPAEVQEGEKDVSDTNTPVLLTLQDAQAWALRDNPTLAAAEAQVKQAAERIRQAQAAFWPQVSLTAGATHTELSDASVDKARAQAAGSSGTAFSSGGVGAQSGFARAQAAARSVAALAAVPDSADSYTVALTANYLLFDGFARNYALSAARIGKKEADLGRLEAARLLLEAVSQAYYGVQLARERVRIAEADRAYNERLLT
ncbi:MAG TPA: TolC family protein, partial [Candidatus Hydrogenedentes bacterium]|nr:TolC family protein [Candidatus Hydrogenedentota bacterium]